jgi:DNA-binding SARP family transcriptional activator
MGVHADVKLRDGLNLRIQLLGRFEVWRNDTLIPAAEWRGQKPRDLLKILLLARGRFVSKDQLCNWLWPGAEPDAAEVNLRSAISDLRKLLEPELTRGRDSAFILTRREGYAFNLDLAAVDLFEFEQVISSAMTRPSLEAALTQYRGDLLEEDPYAEWTILERERLHEVRLEALARLADLRLTEGDYPAAIAACEQALTLDASRETLWRSLMRAYALQGDRAAALRAFDRCRATLARDLGVDPLPETLKLHEQILRDELERPAQNITPTRVGTQSSTEAHWLYRSGAIGIALWVALNGLSLSLSVTGLLRGAFISSGDPGGEALPYLLLHPEALTEIYQRIYLFIPLGILLLPGYLAWFTALRSHSFGVSTAAWLGVSLGIGEVISQTLSRALGLTQLTVLPPAYASASPDQRLTLITLWDVLRQLASAFGVLSATANPLAIALLGWASRRHPRFSPWLVWSGLGLAALTLLYSFFIPSADLAAFWLPLGLGLVLATYIWQIGLAVTLWRMADSLSRIAGLWQTTLL